MKLLDFSCLQHFSLYHVCNAAAEIVPTGDINILDHHHSNDVSMDSKMQLTRSAASTGTGRNELHTDQNQIRVRLQHLESDLTSALHLLRSRAEEKVSDLFLHHFYSR